jgi:hypothetical protein
MVGVQFVVEIGGKFSAELLDLESIRPALRRSAAAQPRAHRATHLAVVEM